ncbi:MAG: hypothetical protein V7784_03950 [Oceanospirillaceae bacterium]
MDNNLVVDALTALPKLMAECIRLLKEGEANRERFFNNGVTPLQNACDTLYKDHVDTLESVFKLIENGDQGEAKKIATQAIIFQQGNTDMLSELVYASSKVNIRGELGELFYKYTRSTSEILLIPDEFYAYALQARFMPLRIGVYTELEKLLYSLTATSADVAIIMNSLSSWYRIVIGNYNDLRVYCLK